MAQTVRDVFESLTPCLGTQSEIKARATWVNVHSAHQSQSCPGRVAGLRRELDIPGPPLHRDSCVRTRRPGLRLPVLPLALTHVSGHTDKDEGWRSGEGAGVTVGSTLLALGTDPRLTWPWHQPLPGNGAGTTKDLFPFSSLGKVPSTEFKGKKKKQKEKVTLKTQVKPPLV